MDYNKIDIDSVAIPAGYVEYMRSHVSFRGKHNRTKGLILYYLSEANTKAVELSIYKKSYKRREPAGLLRKPFNERAVRTVTKRVQLLTIKEVGTVSALTLYRKLNGLVSYGSVRSTLTRLTHYGYIKNYGGTYGLRAQGARFLYACVRLRVLRRWLLERSKVKRGAGYERLPLWCNPRGIARRSEVC